MQFEYKRYLYADGQIGIQEFIDLTGCTTTSAYSTIARACREMRSTNDF